MKYLDLTFADPASNLACDEALLELCEGNEEDGLLRVWEPDHYFVVVGYANKVASEVNITACKVEWHTDIQAFQRGRYGAPRAGLLELFLSREPRAPGDSRRLDGFLPVCLGTTLEVLRQSNFGDC